MAYDIRLSTNYLDHHKILKLKQICGSDAVLAHQRLLLYARENRPDGIFEGMDKDDLTLIIRNEITNVNERYNAVETMLKLRLLDVNSEGDFCIHDWENHNKYSVDSAQKSDINRFCRLKAIAPDIYKKLKNEGVTELSRNQYEEIKRSLTDVNESSNESLTPNPTQPNPTQPKNNIIIAPNETDVSPSELSKVRKLRSEDRIIFDFHEKRWRKITEDDRRRWKEAYPACDIERQLAQMADWLIANPLKRKKNYNAFISNWLSRSQQKGGDIGSNRTQQPRYTADMLPD